MATRKQKGVVMTEIDWTQAWGLCSGEPQFTLERKVFVDAMKELVKAVAGKSSLPVLENVLIAARKQDGAIRMSATDLNIGSSIQLPATVTQDGEITLPAKLLAEVASNMVGSALDISVDAKTKKASIVCGRQRATINGIEAEEFPTLPASGDAEPMVFPGNDLLGMLAFVVPATTKDDSRPALSGVSMLANETSIRVSGADGFRLHSVLAPNPTGQKFEVIVPRGSIEHLVATFSPKADVTITFTEGGAQVTFTQGNRQLVTRLIDACYPDVARIIPDQYHYTFGVSKEELKSELKLAALAAAKSQNVTRWEVSPYTLRMTANAPEYAGTESVMDVLVYDQHGNEMAEGEVSRHGINLTYLEQAVGVIGTNRVRFNLQGSMSPVILKEVNGHDGSVIVIMPMTLRD